MRLCVLCGELQTQPIMTKILITVFLGGGLGSLMRYGMQAAMHGRISPFLFPWATLSVNILGSFLIGMFYVLSARFNLSDETRLFLTTGLCGRQLRHLLALRHPKRGIGRGGGFRRRLGRNNASRKIEYKRRDAKAQSLFLENKDHGENKKPLCPLAFSKK